MIGIIIALKKEAEGLINKISDKKELTFGGKSFYVGNFEGKSVVVAISGIGKVNAAIATQSAIDNFSPEFIINYGSAGGIKGKAKELCYYAADRCCQYDFDLSAIDDVSVGYIQDYDTVYFYPETDGLGFLEKRSLATSDRFTEKSADIDTVESLGCSLFDMEGGAIAQVCTANGIPFYVIKGVTDVHGSGTSPDAFFINLTKVCDGFDGVLKKFFSEKAHA